MTDVALSQAGLRRIIGRQPEAHALVSAFVDALDAQVSIEDVDGRLLHGTILPSSGERFAGAARRGQPRLRARPRAHARGGDAARAPGAERDRAQGARRRGAAPLSRDQPDLQLLGEAGGAAGSRARRGAHAAGGETPHRRDRRRGDAARRGDRRAGVGGGLRRRADSSRGFSTRTRHHRRRDGQRDRRGRQRRRQRPQARDEPHRAQGADLRADEGRRAGHRRSSRWAAPCRWRTRRRS